MGGRSALVCCLGSAMVRGFDHRLQLLARVERDHAARGDGNFLARLGVSPRTRRFLAKLEVAEAGELDAVASLQSHAHLLEEPLDHVLGSTFVEAELLE